MAQKPIPEIYAEIFIDITQSCTGSETLQIFSYRHKFLIGILASFLMMRDKYGYKVAKENSLLVSVFCRFRFPANKSVGFFNDDFLRLPDNSRIIPFLPFRCFG